jgi:hypothetical protein
MIPTDRETYKNWCLRQLGWPVININVDDDQVDDCVTAALEYWHDFHFDGVERMYVKHQLTQTDKDNGYLPVDTHVIGVTRIWPLVNSAYGGDMFNWQYQFRLNDMATFSAGTQTGSFQNYTITRSYMSMLDQIFNGQQPIRYNRHTDKVYFDVDWDKINVGEWLIIEAYIITDPTTYTKAWNDRLLKDLGTAYIKRVWGANMKKFGGMQLPGGITLNGKETYDEAVAEIKEIELKIRLEHEEPPQMQVG